MAPTDELEPLTPREGVELYKQDRVDEVSAATLQSHEYRLERFINWCEREDIDNLNDVTGRDIQRFKLYRKQKVKPVTVKSQMDTLRVFLRFCEAINGVRDGLAESVVSPTLDREDNVSEAILPTEKAETILAYLDKYHYATPRHALLRLLWESGMRMGAAHSIDLDDLYLHDGYLKLKHRPESDTTLKNKKRGERDVALSPELVLLIQDYIDEHRHDVVDDHGREPLFTTKQGRMTKNTLRYHIYGVTRPCKFGEECPYDRDPEDCEATYRRYTASKCPDSRSPHAIRRGAITHFLSEDVPAKVVSDRMNVTTDVLEEHYDARSSQEKMQQRRNHLPGF